MDSTTNKNYTTRVQIKDLNPSVPNVLIIGIIIAKRSPKIITTKKTETEKGVWGFTLRDSVSDFINVTVWGSEDFVNNLNLKFYIGNVVEVINPKVSYRNMTTQDNAYLPDVTSSFTLTCDQEQSEILIHEQTCDTYFPLLRIPTKQADNFITLRDAHDNSKMLANQFLNFLVVVRSLGEVKQIKTKTGEEKETREVTFMDKTLNSMPFTVWDFDVIIQTKGWKPRRTTLFLADFKLQWNRFRKQHVINSSSRSIITENPSTEQGKELASWAYTAFLSPSNENTPYNIDPLTINNVMSCNAVIAKAADEDLTSGFTALVNANVLNFNLDGPELSLTASRCEYCNWHAKEDDDMCTNLDCPSGSGTELPSTVNVFDLAIDLNDHSGDLTNCKLNQTIVTKLLNCTVQDFQKMSEDERTSLKWKYLFKHVAARILVLPTFQKRSKPVITVLSCELVPINSFSTSVPMF